MAKITIELDKNGDTVVTYDNGSIIYPICKINENSFIISKETNITILLLIAKTIIELGKSLKYQLVKQGFINNPLNKSSDSK